MGKITISDMYCTQCGKKNIPVPRNKGKEREPGHLKRMYCIYCDKTVNMVEIRPFGRYTYQDFEFEFKHHNFDKKGNRILPYGELKNKIYNIVDNKKEVDNS